MRKTGRRAFFAQALALIAVGAFGGIGAVYGDSVPDILDSARLKLELRTTTQAQGAYVDDVVDKAKNGSLPVKILTTAYRYAMRHEASKRPIYFKICLERLAGQAGLKLKFLSF